MDCWISNTSDWRSSCSRCDRARSRSPLSASKLPSTGGWGRYQKKNFGEIELNAGRPTVALEVANTGDRPIQVGSHYHFYETNPALEFERARARGYRLNIPAGTAVRFEPGQTRPVELVAYAGERRVYGFRGQVMGALERGKA